MFCSFTFKINVWEFFACLFVWGFFLGGGVIFVLFQIYINWKKTSWNALYNPFFWRHFNVLVFIFSLVSLYIVAQSSCLYLLSSNCLPFRTTWVRPRVLHVLDVRFVFTPIYLFARELMFNRCFLKFIYI